jgi:hypothetical protein
MSELKFECECGGDKLYRVEPTIRKTLLVGLHTDGSHIETTDHPEVYQTDESVQSFACAKCNHTISSSEDPINCDVDLAEYLQEQSYNS